MQVHLTIISYLFCIILTIFINFVIQFSMNEQFIAVLDSGIGGISVLKELVKAFPNESFLYLGDNDNAPYGNKRKEILLSITMRNIDLLKSYPIKALVLACNTLSVNLIDDIKRYSGLPTFGIFPPVESCVLDNNKTLLLATKRTSENYVNIPKLDVVGLVNLVDEIERNMFNLEFVDFGHSLKEYSCGCFFNIKRHYRTVILGCTHYNFIKNKIFDHFQPQKIIDGTTFLIFNLKKYLKSDKSLEKIKRFSILFIRQNAKENQYFFEKSGQID